MKKIIVCPICSEKNNIRLLDSGKFNLYLCKNCKNGFIYPIPRNLSDYYPKIYWQHQGRFSNIREWLHNSFQKDRTKWFKRYLSSGNVLDIGSGEGVFGKMLGNKFKVTNLEYPEAEVKNKSVLKVDFLSWKTKKKFDGIVFLESLEHVLNPQKYLRKASSLLKEDGYIFVEYPRFSSLESHILGKYWLNRDIPRHLFHFTEKGLRNIADRTKLNVVEQKGLMSYQYSPYSLLASIIQILKLPSLNLRLGVTKNIPTLLFLLVGAPLAFILETFFYVIGQSPVGLIVLKRRGLTGNNMLYKFRVMQHGASEFDKNYFGIFFKKYDTSELSFYYRWFKGWINLLDNFLPLKKGQEKKVLEVGCAIGAFSKLLKERGFEVVATDISEFIIEKAIKLQKDVKFKILDIEKDVKVNEKYDYIFAFEVLEHLKHPGKALFNMKKLLKEGGTLVFSTPLPTKQTLADPMHINIHGHDYWIRLGKRLEFKKTYFKDASFIPYFYRFNSIFSFGFPIKINLPFVNNTTFYFFEN